MQGYEVAIVGSGAGGAPLSEKLSKKGIKVVILEKGAKMEIKDAGKYYDRPRSKQGVEVMRAVCYGGTTTVSVGLGPRVLEKEFKDLGIDLNEEFLEVEKELNIKPVPDEKIGKGSRLFMETAKDLGFKVNPMPKFVDYEKCPKGCTQCLSGCRHGSKKSAIDYLEKAIENGAEIVTDFEVREVMIEKGKAWGVRGTRKVIPAEKVVLSAGALETPRILSRSGIKAGDNLFIDTIPIVGGVVKGINFDKESLAPVFLRGEGFMLIPTYRPVYDSLKSRGLDVKPSDVFAIMIKIADEGSGRVNSDGTIDKSVTAEDARVLCKAAAASFGILFKMGVDPKTITATTFSAAVSGATGVYPGGTIPAMSGAHPGGTAAIGKVVDKNLETDIDGLYVCDASVFPIAPGGPPIVTIMALSKRLANYITDKKAND